MELKYILETLDSFFPVSDDNLSFSKKPLEFIDFINPDERESKAISGIGICLFPEYEVIKKAFSHNLNFIISYFPLFPESTGGYSYKIDKTNELIIYHMIKYRISLLYLGNKIDCGPLSISGQICKLFGGEEISILFDDTLKVPIGRVFYVEKGISLFNFLKRLNINLKCNSQIVIPKSVMKNLNEKIYKTAVYPFYNPNIDLVRQLKSIGCECLISGGFHPIIRNVVIKYGILPLELPLECMYRYSAENLAHLLNNEIQINVMFIPNKVSYTVFLPTVGP